VESDLTAKIASTTVNDVFTYRATCLSVQRQELKSQSISITPNVERLDVANLYSRASSKRRLHDVESHINNIYSVLRCEAFYFRVMDIA
jgi:hypothetical protein